MPANVRALIVLPDDTTILEAEIGGRPAGEFLLERLGRCEGIELAVDATAADGGVLVVDARAWLSEAALAAMVRHGRETPSAFRVVIASATSARAPRKVETLAAWCPPGRTPQVEPTRGGFARALGSGVFWDATLVDASQLDAADTPLLLSSFAALAEAEHLLLRGRAMAVLNQGVRLRDPGSLHIRGELVCGAGVEIDLDVIVEGRVVLEDGVRIGAHAILTESHIGRNTRIKPFSLVEGARVGADCQVGPYARLRPGSTIGDRSQIGNYVEIKNARVGAGGRINHHSFIGDAELGEGVTIGAGTITCNHDGVGTAHTVIERDAYIGSGCKLVAPVTIAAGATVGAGSTITSDVPAGKLTVARSRQITIDHWRRRERTPPRA